MQDPTHLAQVQANLLAAAVEPREREHVRADAAALAVAERLRVGDEQGVGGAAQRPHLAQPQPARSRQQPRGAAAVGEGVGAAAPLDHARPRIVQRSHGQQVLGRRGRAGQPRGAHPGGQHVDLARLRVQRFHREQAAARAEHDARAVGRRLAQIALRGVQGGVAAQVGAVGGDGPEVRRGPVGQRGARAGGVRGEQQPVPVPGDPQLGGEDLLEQRLPGADGMGLGGSIERDVLAGEPQLHGGAAAVVLPSGLVTAPRGGHHGGA